LLVSTTIILFWNSNISIFISKVFLSFSLSVIILIVIKLLSLFFGITIDIIGYALLILVPPFMVLGIGLGIVIRDLINKLKNK
jgi:TRAP-type C4-dicarboxylate transport system permease large subunit